MRDSMSPADLGTKVWPVAPSTWVEYGGMLLDTTICAAVCTWRLTTLMTPSRSESRSKALQERLRLLLFNTISSFIFPAISALVMIILAASSSFDTYSSAPKINSGIVAMNVLIAMLIPIIDASVTENRQTAQRDAALTDSFLRQHKSRSMSLTTSPQLGIVSGNGGGGARPSSRAGVLPTTMVERLEQLQQQQQQRQQQQQQRYVGDMMRSGSGSGSDADKEVLELQQRRRRVPSGASGSDAANGRALANVSDTHSPRPGTATSLGWPASDPYEPSMVEKTPVLDYSLESPHRKDDDELELGDGDDETGLTHWNSARRSSNSLGSIRRERARDGIEGEREVMSAVPPLPVPAPTLFSAETNPGRPVATTTTTTTTTPMSPSARRRASPGPAPGSGGTGLSLSDSERSLGSDQLATTDEHRIRLRSMPRRKRP
ncbi:hypothetical protein OC844_007039 [Tilletia horrida]|nr:hypothetical protein OC844_007039 [Tilletia horrida]